MSAEKLVHSDFKKIEDGEIITRAFTSKFGLGKKPRESRSKILPFSMNVWLVLLPALSARAQNLI